MKATGDKTDRGWGQLIEGLEYQAEDLGLSTVSNREPQVVLEQGSNHEQSNWMCASYLQSACLFSMEPDLCRPHTEFQLLQISPQH